MTEETPKKSRKFLLLCILVLALAAALLAIMEIYTVALLAALAAGFCGLILAFNWNSPLPIHKLKSMVIGIVFLFLLLSAFHKMHLSIPPNPLSASSWDAIVLHEHLPEPPVFPQHIYDNKETELHVLIEGITPQAFSDYQKACRDMGFEREYVKDGLWLACDPEGYRLQLHLRKYTDLMELTLEPPIALKEITWPRTGPAGQLAVPESHLGQILRRTPLMISAYVGNTDYKAFEAYCQALEDLGYVPGEPALPLNFRGTNAQNQYVSVNYLGGHIMEIFCQAESAP